jgi:hypothetical protein
LKEHVLKYPKHVTLSVVCALLVVALGCGSDSPTEPSGGGPSLTAPSVEAPASDQQLDTLRPTLTVRNGSSDQSGARTYEFQVSTSDSFATIAASRSGVPEDASGRTSAALEQDLQPSTRFFWRARFTQASTSSAWSAAGSFRSKLVGFNRPGELYDPLVSGESVGTPFGSTTFVPGRGLRINDQNSWLRYQLAQTVAAGEFSMEVEGPHPNGPGPKLKIFSMFDGTGSLTASRYQLSTQYRGSNGNPANCVAFKAVWGDTDVILEPNLAKRAASIVMLDPSRTYLWAGIWNTSSFRLVIRDGGASGPVVYDHTITAPGGAGPYAPSPHFAYLGANSGPAGVDTGSWPGAIYRNVWLGDRPRPTSLGSALRPLD